MITAIEELEKFLSQRSKKSFLELVTSHLPNYLSRKEIKMEPMNVKLWGTRGSIPCPSTDGYVTSKYGGNTPCVEIIGPEGKEHIIDMGSGLRNLGNDLLGRGFLPGSDGWAKGRANIYQSHVHHDHIQGFGFFAPAFMRGNEINFFSGEFEEPLEDLLNAMYRKPLFPVTMADMGAEFDFTELKEGKRYRIDDLIVTAHESSHPDKCYAYKFEREAKFGLTNSFVYLVDNEHDPKSKPGRLTQMDKDVVRFMRDADLVLMDSAYTPEQYAGKAGPPRQGWGHSTYDMNVVRAAEANINHVLLTHHDPSHADKHIKGIGAAARQYAISIGASNMNVEMAVEGANYEV